MDKAQLFPIQMIFAGIALIVLGCWFGWPRRLASHHHAALGFGFGRAQMVVGVVVAVLGLVLAVIGLVLLPLFQ